MIDALRIKGTGANIGLPLPVKMSIAHVGGKMISEETKALRSIERQLDRQNKLLEKLIKVVDNGLSVEESEVPSTGDVEHTV